MICQRTTRSRSSGSQGLLGEPRRIRANCEIAAEINAPLLVGKRVRRLKQRKTRRSRLFRTTAGGHMKTIGEIRAGNSRSRGATTVRVHWRLRRYWAGSAPTRSIAEVLTASRRDFRPFKDVRAAGGHEPVALEKGVVPRGSVSAFCRNWVSRCVVIEHEPDSFDPEAFAPASIRSGLVRPNRIDEVCGKVLHTRM